MDKRTEAQLFLTQKGMSDAWKVYMEPSSDYEENTITGIVDRLVRYGSISDKQVHFIKEMLDRIIKHDVKCPASKAMIRGEVIKTSIQESQWGNREVMTVKDQSGFLVWGTVPSSLRKIKKGDTVEFTATVTPLRSRFEVWLLQTPYEGEEGATMTEVTDKCPMCGKFVSQEDGFYTREYTTDEGFYMVVCCDEKCADKHERRVKEINNIIDQQMQQAQQEFEVWGDIPASF